MHVSQRIQRIGSRGRQPFILEQRPAGAFEVLAQRLRVAQFVPRRDVERVQGHCPAIPLRGGSVLMRGRLFARQLPEQVRVGRCQLGHRGEGPPPRGAIVLERRGNQVELDPRHLRDPVAPAPRSLHDAPGPLAVTAGGERLRPGDIGGTEVRVGVHGTLEGRHRGRWVFGCPALRQRLQRLGLPCLLGPGARLHPARERIGHLRNSLPQCALRLESRGDAPAGQIFPGNVQTDTAAGDGEVSPENCRGAGQRRLARAGQPQRMHLGRPRDLSRRRFAESPAHPVERRSSLRFSKGGMARRSTVRRGLRAHPQRPMARSTAAAAGLQNTKLLGH